MISLTSGFLGSQTRSSIGFGDVYCRKERWGKVYNSGDNGDDGNDEDVCRCPNGRGDALTS